MNILVLDGDLEKCAQYHCDNHVNRMCTEYSQLLSTTARMYGIEAGYEITHQDHPSAVWVRQSVWHFMWLRNLLWHLHQEYLFRFGGKKKQRHEGAVVGLSLPIPLLEDNGFIPPPQVMPKKYHHEDVIVAYRRYYYGEKRNTATYKGRQTPFFMIGELTEEELVA